MLANTNTLVPQHYCVLKALEQGPYEFFLTGSRYFGGYRDGSDYDFFVQESEGVESYLRAMDFVEDTDAAYEGDPTFVKVMTLATAEGVIQVQLIKSKLFARKQLVQKLLQGRYQGRGLPGEKIHQKELWHLTNHILESLSL